MALDDKTSPLLNFYHGGSRFRQRNLTYKNYKNTTPSKPTFETFPSVICKSKKRVVNFLIRFYVYTDSSRDINRVLSITVE